MNIRIRSLQILSLLINELKGKASGKYLIIMGSDVVGFSPSDNQFKGTNEEGRGAAGLRGLAE